MRFGIGVTVEAALGPIGQQFSPAHSLSLFH
jgi:hypothetical protein